MRFLIDVDKVDGQTSLHSVDAGCIVKLNGYNAMIRVVGVILSSVGFTMQLKISYVDKVEDYWEELAVAYVRSFNVYKVEGVWDMSPVINSIRKDLKKELYREFGIDLISAIKDLSEQLTEYDSSIQEISQSELYIKVNNRWVPTTNVSEADILDFKNGEKHKLDTNV